MARTFTLRKRVKLLVGNLRSIRDKETLTPKQTEYVNNAGSALVNYQRLKYVGLPFQISCQVTQKDGGRYVH